MTVGLLLEVYDRVTERLVAEHELPLAAAGELRNLFAPGETAFPFLFGLYPVSTGEQEALIQRWCPDMAFDFSRCEAFVGGAGDLSVRVNGMASSSYQLQRASPWPAALFVQPC